MPSGIAQQPVPTVQPFNAPEPTNSGGSNNNQCDWGQVGLATGSVSGIGACMVGCALLRAPTLGTAIAGGAFSAVTVVGCALAACVPLLRDAPSTAPPTPCPSEPTSPHATPPSSN